jgi:hypothetical protein
MTTTRTLSTAVLFVAALALVGCRPPVEFQDPNAPDDAVSGDGEEAFVGTVGDLMKDGRDVNCTFSRTDEAGTMEGTVYVARDGRMAGEFDLESPQFGAMTMHVIRDGEYGYTWGFPSDTEGTKIKLDNEGKPIKDNDKEGPSIDDDSMEYHCRTWRVDTDMFEPPSDVVFQDISETMEAINEAMGGVKNAQCGACDNLDPAGRDACRTAMRC